MLSILFHVQLAFHVDFGTFFFFFYPSPHNVLQGGMFAIDLGDVDDDLSFLAAPIQAIQDRFITFFKKNIMNL